MGKKRRRIWSSIPICIFWVVLNERNKIVFSKGTLNVQKLKFSFVYNLCGWNRKILGDEVSTLLCFLEWLTTA